MKITTWNVNSLRVRLPHLLDSLAAQAPRNMGLRIDHAPVVCELAS